MNLGILVWSYLSSRPLNTALNVLLLALGIAVVTILIIVDHQVRDKISTNARGIDLVVGAKGSPMQLILCNIFHVDYPTGNINLAEAERIARNRLVRKAIPMALGDSYHGFRIVGTTHDYAQLYEARVEEGSWWEKPMEVVIGQSVSDALRLNIGSHFTSSHGLVESGHAHDSQDFVVKGILAETNTVLDNLILTGVQSVWVVHDMHGEAADLSDADSASMTGRASLIPGVASGDSTKEIASMLIQYRSAMGAIQMPRMINSQTSLQAASPAFETARLFSIIGVGVEVLTGFAYVLIFISALSILIALYNSLKERRYDLAMMRSMGASKSKVFFSVLLEGAALTFVGTFVGLALGHGMLILFSETLPEARRSGITGLEFYWEEGIILVGSLLLGMACALIPALQAYRTDISRVLASS